MLNNILNLLCFRQLRVKKAEKQFLDCIESEFAEEFLELLLKTMKLVFMVDNDFRRNINNFNARYLFKSKDDQITMAVIFKNAKMKVYEKKISNTDITIIFKNGNALLKYLLSPKTDILGAILNQDVTFQGNLNFLSKFAFMSKRLQLMITDAL
jgi:hypothetical protein